ncbi:MAG: hypothetical protein HKN08_07230, partial [Gammaproteobacteria bacterium]|nr:hypothetical protein [Gammaproteobacteria bacterium]
MSEPTPSNLSRYQNLVVWLIAIAIIAGGGYLTNIAFLGHEWLSRAGCLIVILGIWSGLGGLIQEQILLGRLRWRRRNAIVRVRAELESKDTEPADIDRELDAVEDSFEKQSN